MVPYVDRFPNRRTNMQYELTVKLLIETGVDKDRVTRQVESLFAFGTVLESFAEAQKLDKDPHFLSVAVSANSPRTTTVG
jgi:hypothetical protein